ncbi:hypothetical protein QAD02_023470 [Eretmocerus hayati]|uniref:Uncharacterized protein n=1 Tax=Eretmocerus hayati TaxID=131215 RepID=A0ACC2PXL2_9HYME|nr:hypothetical protein QAD02_023470 [Eretmocerus hayati]
MNKLLLIVLLCGVVSSQAQYPGYPGSLSDTPEVQAAKAAHFEEFARAAARAAAEKDESGRPELGNPSAGLSAYERQQQPAPVPSAYSFPSAPSFGPETYYPGEPKGYGSLPTGFKSTFVAAPLADDGTVVDTPEVAAVKSERLRALAEAEARAYAQGNDEYSGEPGYQKPSKLLTKMAY